MIRQRSQILCAWFLIWDVILTAGAWIVAYYVRFQTGWIPITKNPPDAYHCWINLPVVVFLAMVAYHLTGQYAVHRLRRFREEVVCVLKGTALLSLLVMATTFYLHDPYESRATMVIFSLLAGLSVLAARRLSWSAIRQLRSRGFHQTHA